MQTTTVFRLLLMIAASAAPVCAEDKLPNVLCPLMTKEDAESDHKISYQGKDIYLCCGSCEKQWDKDPDYYAALARELKLLPQLSDIKVAETVKLMPQYFCPFNTTRLVGPNSSSVEYKGVKIYFSKLGHIKTWNENPDQYAKAAFDKGLLPQLAGKL